MRTLQRYIGMFALLAVLLAILGIDFALRGMNRFPLDPVFEVHGGDPERGRQAVARHGCGACHKIPGVRVATGRVGPQLADFRHQIYIAGVLPNTPTNLVAWIRHPQEINPLTAMPDLDISESEARDMAAYLYTVP